MEKNIKKNVHLCITESLGCTAEMNTTILLKKTRKKKLGLRLKISLDQLQNDCK